MKIFFIKNRIVCSAAIILIGLISFGFMLQSCSDAFNDIAPYNTDTGIVSQTERDESLTWEERLEKIMNTPPNIMVNSGIELLDYEIISGSIDNAVDENFYKEEIKADDNMIPFYSDDLKSLTAITRSEAILKSSPHQTFNFEEGDKFVDKMNLKGAKILKVKWNNNGTETHTVCAVSDREGILYDNFLSHCFEIKTEESVVVSKNETTDIPAKTPRLKAGSETVSSDGTVTWILTVEAWKASAGIVASIKITHIAYYTYGVFFYHYYSATHNCKIEEGATAVAKVKSINNKTIAYGYGLSAISSISISVTETGSGYNATMSPIDFNVASIGDGTHSHN